MSNMTVKISIIKSKAIVDNSKQTYHVIYVRMYSFIEITKIQIKKRILSKYFFFFHFVSICYH